jgi:glycogen operon protein
VVEREQLRVYIILNAYWEQLNFELPLVGDHAASWRRWIDTSIDSPLDIFPWDDAPVVIDRIYRAAARSVVVLFAKIGRLGLDG